MVTAVLANLGVLAIFKYSAFLVQNINATAHFSLPVPQMHFPVGISFFTFQALSYVIDVYREPDTCQKNFIKLLLYISLFPQLIAGPIVKYHDIAAEIDSRTVTAKETAEGLRRFFCGLAKKVLIADVLGLAVDKIYALPATDLCAASAWFAAVAYALQIYFDFSGYSDMAIGMGQMFGFHFKENFNHPYYADSIQDFWRRWHISLSAWFKEYLYFPLGGNRKGKARTVLNKYIVFFCTGLWHGANWTFVLWGLYHGTFAMLEQLNIIPVKKIRCRPVKQFYACLVAVIGFVIFRAANITQAGCMLGTMFTGFGMTAAQASAFFAACPVSCLLALAAGLVCSMPLLNSARRFADGRQWAVRCSFVGVFLLFLVSALQLASGTYSPFIYFRF